MSVGVLEARNNLSSLIRDLEEGKMDSVIIMRNNKPVARLVATSPASQNNRIGIAKGMILYADESWDSTETNREAAALFGVSL